MKTQTVIFGVILVVVGVVVAVIFTTNITGRTHQYIPAGGIGLAILGGILSILGATAKAESKTEQFKCEVCGTVFGSDIALKSHTKDKHGSKP